MIQIPRSVLELILHAARTNYPNEFGAMIRGEGNKIKEVLLLPGTIQGRRFASFRMNMLPIESNTIGVCHSHPSGNKRPSANDLNLFSKVGNVNIILGYPYQGLEDVAGYDGNGNPQDVEVI